MKIHFKSEEKCDMYFFFETSFKEKIILPSAISLKDFLFFLQASLDRIKPVLILKNETVLEFINLDVLKSTHFTIDENFIFLNYSIRNSLKSTEPYHPVYEFEEIRTFLEKILKK